MRAELIAFGDELVSGQSLDTNSPWLSEQLAQLGIHVHYHTTVGDDVSRSVEVWRQAFARVELVISTGGLGPTADDLTREALAEALGAELVFDAGMLEQIGQLFQRRGREMPERNRVQALRPSGSLWIPNPHGTAPGIHATHPRSRGGLVHCFALPGVPAEMKEMFSATVAPWLRVAAGIVPRVIRHHRMKCFGVGESDLEAMLPDLIRRGRQPSVGITVHQATITLRITAEGENDEDCRAAMQPTIDTIRGSVGELLFGEEDDELQHAVLRMLEEKRASLAVAEWGSAGILGQWLADAAKPESGTFRGSVTVGGTDALESILPQVAPALERHGPASAPLSEALAVAARERFSADWGLGVGRFPAAAAAHGEESWVHFAVASAGGVESRRARYAGHPHLLIPRAAKQALDLLRRALLRVHPA